MQLKFAKLHSLASLPQYSQTGDGALDLACVSSLTYTRYIEYDTGIAVEIPDGYVGLVFPRSSVSDTGLSLSNAVGVIDSKYRQSIKLRFYYNRSSVQDLANFEIDRYRVGDRIGQLMLLPIPFIEPEFVTTLSETERGVGFGSSGA